jgi:predicted RNase H-like HicB family nuclease
MYTYKVLLHKEAEGGFTVLVPALPGCITYGQDVDEAITMAREAITLYIEELKDRGEKIPVHGGKDLKKGTFFAILKQAGIDKSLL